MNGDDKINNNILFRQVGAYVTGKTKKKVWSFFFLHYSFVQILSHLTESCLFPSNYLLSTAYSFAVLWAATESIPAVNGGGWGAPRFISPSEGHLKRQTPIRAELWMEQ